MRNIFTLLAVTLVLSGCISPKSYVNPEFGGTSYNDIKTVAKKHDAKIEVEFQRNGEPLSGVNQEVKNHVERTLRATGVINPVLDNSEVSLKVTVNNIADVAEARVKGFGTGLTFGAAGSTVSDYYEVTIIYISQNGIEHVKNYKHELVTTIGNASAPFNGVLPTTIADGFGTIVEQVMLNFIKEMQAEGKLTFLEQTPLVINS